MDPYGLVCKAGVWYLVADSDGEPRLFRVSRVASAVADEEPARRRDGAELAQVWESLRRQVEDRPAGLLVTARVRRELLDMFGRICAANLDGPLPVPVPADHGDAWAVVRLRYRGVPAARMLLGFGGGVQVVSPEEVRADLACVAAEVVASYSNMNLGMR